MTQQSAGHPDQKVLAEFGLGRLDPSESSWIEEHLAECPTCCDTLLNLKDDTFTGLVRSLPEPADESILDVQPGSTADVTEVDEPRANSSKPDATDGAILNAESSHAVTMLVLSGDPIEPSDLPDELREHPRYRIVEKIGSGGMGDVYRAEHRLMNRSVALKLINSQLVKHPLAVERFRREVQAAARLTHPNIVTAFDAEQAGDVHFLVMEFVEGIDLATVVQQRGPLPVEEACDHIHQAAGGLQHAHEKGMVHRDIKPHNLMLSPDGQVRILDFGLAGFATESAILEVDSAGGNEGDTTPLHLTTFGSVMGTPDYIAPEQARDAHSADIRADIYSLGCTLCFLLTGKAPFADSKSVIDKLKAHADQTHPALDSVRADVPSELADIVARMMAKDPADRFQRPDEVAIALAPFCKYGTEPAAAPVNRPPRRRTITAVCAAAIISLLASVVFVVTDQGTFEIKSKFDDVEIVVSKGGEEFTVIDLATDSKVQRLPSGDYKISLKGRSDLKLDKDGFTLNRFGNAVATVTLKPTTRPVVSQTPDVAAKDQIAETSRLKGHSDSIGGLAYSADGKYVYSIGGGENLLYQWDPATGKVLRKVPVGGVPTGIAVLPDSQHVITSQYDGSITLWNMGTGRAVRQFSGHTQMVDDICVTPDGKCLLSGGHDGLVRLWDIETSTPIHSFHEKYCDCVAISSDGRLAAHGTSNSGWRIWEIESGQMRPRKERPSTNLLSLAFSPDSKYIVSGDGYGTIQVWDVAADTELSRFDSHRDAVTSLLFTRDGRHFLSGSVDRTFRFFDVSKGLEVGHVESNTMCVTNLALSPDGKTLATGGGIRIEHVDGALKFHKDGDYDIHLSKLPESLWPKAEAQSQRAPVAGSNPKKTNTGILTNPPSVPPGGLPVGKNLIVDPSLEEASTGSLPKGWFAWLDDGPNFKCEVVEGGVTGKHCLQISGTGTRGVVFATSIPLDRTKRYALKGRVKVEGEAGTWAVIKLNYFNSTGWLGVDDRVGVTTSDLDWKLFEKIDAADKYPGATLIVPTCHIEGNGTAWFDDLEVIAYDRDKLPANFDATHGKNNRMK